MFSVEEICKANEAILNLEGTPERYHLRDRSHILGRLDLAADILGDTPTHRDVIHASASLLYGIAWVQAFTDGNRRTALFVAHNLLKQYGLDDILDIEKGADYKIMNSLNQLVERGTVGESDFIEILETRYQKNSVS